MIMPANYSAIAENELSYVNGGWVDPITSTKTLQKNIVEYIGNAFSGKVIDAFIGTWFVYNGNGSVGKDLWTNISGLFTNGAKEGEQGTGWGRALRGLTNTIGVLAGIYNLGMYDDAVKVADVGGGLSKLKIFA